MTREEAINTVRNIYQTDKEKEALEILIPELKESKEERIRKALYELFKAYPLYGLRWDDVPDDIRIVDVLDWLEKQKEHKSAELRDKFIK